MFIIAIRRVKFEAELSNMTWQVKYEDVVMTKGKSLASTSRLSMTALSEAISKVRQIKYSL